MRELRRNAGTGTTATSGRQLQVRQIAMERYNSRERLPNRQTIERVPVLTLHSRTQLVLFLAFICQYAMVDTANFIPIGVLMYATGITIALEHLTMDPRGHDVWQEDHESRWEQQLEHAQHQRQIEAALFEYHVLKGRPHVQIVPIREHGRTVLYAIDRSSPKKKLKIKSRPNHRIPT